MRGRCLTKVHSLPRLGVLLERLVGFCCDCLLARFRQTALEQLCTIGHRRTYDFLEKKEENSEKSMTRFDEVKTDYADSDQVKAACRPRGVWRNGCPGTRSPLNVAEWRAYGLTGASKIMNMRVVGSAIATGWGRSAGILRKQAFLIKRTDAIGRGTSSVSDHWHGIVQRVAMDTRGTLPASTLLRGEGNVESVVNSVSMGT